METCDLEDDKVKYVPAIRIKAFLGEMGFSDDDLLGVFIPENVVAMVESYEKGANK